MPFWKVWKDNSSRGRGVVGVLEENFIEPAHDKQDFEKKMQSSYSWSQDSSR